MAGTKSLRVPVKLLRRTCDERMKFKTTPDLAIGSSASCNARDNGYWLACEDEK